MRRKVVLAAAAAVIAATVPALAHHSFAAQFDDQKPVTLRGKLTKMEWSNPHGWIYIDVTGPDGKVVNWAIEAGSPNTLVRRGLRPADFPVGTEVVEEVKRVIPWSAALDVVTGAAEDDVAVLASCDVVVAAAVCANLVVSASAVQDVRTVSGTAAGVVVLQDVVAGAALENVSSIRPLDEVLAAVA